MIGSPLGISMKARGPHNNLVLGPHHLDLGSPFYIKIPKLTHLFLMYVAAEYLCLQPQQ